MVWASMSFQSGDIFLHDLLAREGRRKEHREPKDKEDEATWRLSLPYLRSHVPFSLPRARA